MVAHALHEQSWIADISGRPEDVNLLDFLRLWDFGNPWEFERAEVLYSVGFGGSVETKQDEQGQLRQIWWPVST